MASGVKSMYKCLYSLWIFLVSIDFFLLEVTSTSMAEVDRHLQMGMQLLARGQFQDALTHLHAAIDGDPSNYMTYYRRATVYLALGRSRLALQDLDEVLKLKPDFKAAHVQRASILLKLGRLDEAYESIQIVLEKDSGNDEAVRIRDAIVPLREKVSYIEYAMDYSNYAEAIPLLNEVIEECSWDYNMRQLRSDAYLSLGNIRDAISDLKVVTKLTQDNYDGYYRLSELYYAVGDVYHSLTEIRECLKLDPDHKDCFALYKKVKKVGKLIDGSQENFEQKEFDSCVTKARKILKEEPYEAEVRFLAHEKICQCGGDIDAQEALNACDEAINIKEESRLYCDRAEVHILTDNFDEALSDFQQALNVDENNQRAKEGINKVQKLQKQAKKRDYYKILGVKRTATKKEIKKAYRELAQKWHPDHFEGEMKEKAEQKFIDIAAAKEVLTDDEKRAKFDNGEDPLDPEAQQRGHGFNPFQHFAFRQGGFPGGGFDGGNFHFKFHYN